MNINQGCCWSDALIVISGHVLYTSNAYFSGFEVTSSGACDGRKWEVAWKTKGGDQPPMQATGEGLIGSQPQVNVERVVDGGVWLRPLRGDMLRLPEYDPQVHT